MAVTNLNTGALAEQLGGFQTLATAGESLRNSEMAALEAADSLASEGIVHITGLQSATETVVDTFAGVATAEVAGTFSATETDVDTFAGVATVEVSGALSVAEVGDDTFAGVATAEVSGALAVSEVGDDVFAGAGTVEVYAVFSATEAGDDSSQIIATVEVAGALAATEATDTIYVLGNVLVQGYEDASEEPDTASGAGDVEVNGTANALELNDTLSGVARVRVNGALASTEMPDTFAGVGYVVDAGAIVKRKQGRKQFRGIEDAKVFASGRRSVSRTGVVTLVVINPPAQAVVEHGWSMVASVRAFSRSGYVRVAVGGGSALAGGTSRTNPHLARAVGVAITPALGRRAYAMALTGDQRVGAYGAQHTTLAGRTDVRGVSLCVPRGGFSTTDANYCTARGETFLPTSRVVAVAALHAHNNSRRYLDRRVR
ncbi:hypothetical protein K0U83_15680 [bacterium]|nr:hypothetical protein [bacterium]